MENTNTSDIILWFIAGLTCIGMIAVLTKGWLKGNQWQREMKVRKKQTQRI